MQKAIQLFLGSVIALLIAWAPITAQETGTSCADCPNYAGAYSIENATGITIEYQYRWGNQHAWKTMRLASGAVERHSYPLGDDPHKQVPAPYVRFDRIGGDGGVTLQEYKMQFFAIGYAGYGAPQNTNTPKRYVFRFAANGRDLDLFVKR